MKLYNRILTLVMVVFLGMFSLISIYMPDRSFSEEENRMLKQIPSFSWKELISGEFTSDFETYVTDQFPFRDSWVRIKSATELMLQRRDNNGVYFGKDGYLLQKPGRVDEELVKRNIDAINKFASALGDVPVYFLFAPNAVQILGDKLPPYADTDKYDTSDLVRKNLSLSVNFIDIYHVLMNQNREYIFYRTDHHWTSRGAYYAYCEAGKAMGFTALGMEDFNVERVTDSFYGTLYSKSGMKFIEPDSIELYKPLKEIYVRVEYMDTGTSSSSLYEIKHLDKKDKYSVFLDGNHALTRITTNAGTGRRLAILKDSYAHSLVPFLASHYDEIHMIDLRYFNLEVKEYIEQHDLKEVLLIYNALSFSEDSTIPKMALGL